MATQAEIDASKERIAASLKDKPKGKRGPNGEQELIQLDARDLFVLASSTAKPTWITAAQEKGTTPHFGHPNPAKRQVFIYVDHAHHIHEQPTTAGDTPVIPEGE